MAKLTYTGPSIITANQLFQYALRVDIEEDIAPGGVVYVGVRHISDIGRPQNTNPADENYVSFAVSNPTAKLRFHSQPHFWGFFPWETCGIMLELAEGKLQKGDTVTIAMGAEGRGFRAQSFSEFRSGFRVGVKTNADAEWVVAPVEEARMFEVVGAEATRVRAYVKDVNNAKREKTICVKMEDIYSNIASLEKTEPLVLDVLLDDKYFLGSLDINEGATMHTGFVVPDDGKWHTLSLATKDGKFFARTNPFGPPLVDGLNLYFGDLHSQSDWCDGTNLPKEIYHYAKIAAGLDLAAVSSHDIMLSAEAWQDIQAATKEAHEPGAFVTLLGYEWSGERAEGGDHNIYFNSDEGTLVRSGVVQSPWGNPSTPAEHNNMRETIAKLKKEKHGFMVIPHCGGRVCNFDYYDPSVMPVFEIHSTHRNYEHIWREAVDRGFKMGLCGGSDDHRGAIGDCSLSARDVFYSAHCGLICVLAEEMTRAKIWEAIQKRHTYATNGPHIALSFTLNGTHIMGDEVEVKEGATLAFKCRVLTHGFFERVEFYRGNTLVKIGCGGNHFFQNRITDYEDAHTETAQRGVQPYYVKAVQIDGGLAWSSPIFVKGVP